MRKSKLEIIEETVAYYSEDVNRRGTTPNGGCAYYTEDGKMCAVGRCLVNAKKFDKDTDKLNTLGFIFNIVQKGINLNARLKPEYRGHKVDFWTNLQQLHDGESYWDEDGITKRGKEYVEQLKKDYNEEVMPNT